MKKIILPLILTVLLVPVLIFIYILEGRLESNDPIATYITFTIQSGDYQEDISAWSEDGETYYVFLPSYAGPSDVSLQLNTSAEMFLNGQPLTEGYDFGALEIETPYALGYSYHGAARTVQLEFLQSANVATMYIHTESGSMDEIDADKEYKENAEIILVDVEGNINYAGRGSDKMKSRGNSTWSYSKKPYTLQLHEANTMLGMDAAEKWVLLANSTDVSNIRNKVVYDFAEKTNLYWTPDCEYVDLYLNGEYAGLYLLTEKIEVAEPRLDLNEDAYLFAIETGMADLENYFSTEAGQQIEIKNPTDLSSQEVDDFQDYIQSVENSILEGSNDLFDIIDLDSWVRKYLIEEIFENIDSGRKSQYFYVDKDSDKIYAGPIWDYDLSIGNELYLSIQNPKCLFSSTLQKTDTSNTPWYAALYNNEIFYNRLVEIYQNEYLPLLNDLMGDDLNSLSDRIEQAAAGNNIRWASLFTGGRTYNEDVQYIGSFMKERTAFLDHAWIDGTRYCTIQIDAGLGDYLYFNVEPGQAIDSLPTPRELGISDSEVWYIDGTDAAFDVTEPVEKDMFLRIQTASELEAKARTAEAETKSIRPSLAALFIMMLVLFVLDWRRNQSREEKTHEQRRQTGVST